MNMNICQYVKGDMALSLPGPLELQHTVEPLWRRKAWCPLTFSIITGGLRSIIMGHLAIPGNKERGGFPPAQLSVIPKDM